MHENPEVDTLLESIKKEAAHLGLHMKDCMIMNSADMNDPQVAAQFKDKSLKEIMEEDDDISVVVMAYFLIGDLAFSDRVQHPEQFDMDQQFNLLVPTKQELTKDKIKEKLAANPPSDDDDSWLEALFDDDDDDF
jgi:hypothetical protein